MAVTLITILVCAFIVSTYREVLFRSLQRRQLLKGSRVPLLLLGLVIIPILFINLFRQDPSLLSPQEMMEFGDRYEYQDIYHEGIERTASAHPDDAILQLECLHFYFEGYLGVYSCREAADRYKEEKRQADLIASSFVKILCDFKQISEKQIAKLDTSVHGASYVKGLYYDSLGNFQRSLDYFEHEIIKTPDFSSAYRAKARLLKRKDPEKYRSFLIDQAGSSHLYYGRKNSFFFNQGLWGPYFINIFSNRIVNTSWLVIIVAFIVSFIWMYYLRLMDHYNREKWLHVLLVFVLGGLFINFCLPVYDLSHYVFGFYLDGSPWNDFLYCTLVIGGGEELVKMLPWVIFGLFSRKLKEPFDYILYASAAALGFAFIENFAYLEDYRNISSRAIITSVSHMFDATIIAYAFIIVRFKMHGKNVLKKAVVIVIGFLLAMFAHGFYDFWLISPSVSGWYFLTLIFFVLSLHVWFFFKQNAMNHSPFFRGNERFNLRLQKDALYIAVIGVVMLQYMILGFDLGATYVNSNFHKEMGYVGVFLFYMTIQLNKFKVAKGVWHKLSFKKMIPFKRLSHIGKVLGRFTLGSGYSRWDEVYETSHTGPDLRGLQLRLFAPKSNRYIGSQLPVTGYCSKRMIISGEEGWYLFRLNKKVFCNDFLTDTILIKSKQNGKTLLDDKIEIYFMFIPTANILDQGNISIQDLRFAGRAYSRPLNAENYAD